MLYVNVFNLADPTTTELYTLSLHDALPISLARDLRKEFLHPTVGGAEGVHAEDGLLQLLQPSGGRSEEHTSEHQPLTNLVCRLLLVKKQWFQREAQCNNRSKRKTH